MTNPRHFEIGDLMWFTIEVKARQVEESFEVETNDEGATSEDVQAVGAFALLVPIPVFLFVSAGLAKVAMRTSLALLALSVPMLLGLVFTDPTSLFAVTYYLGLILIGMCAVLMFPAWKQATRGAVSGGAMMTALQPTISASVVRSRAAGVQGGARLNDMGR